MALTTKTIVNDGQFLVVTSSSGNVESINLAVIKNITYTYVASPPGTYNYTDMCLLTVEFADREADLSFDLASITNQAGWTLDEAGCIQAESDIRTWAKASGGGGGGDATEATQLLIEGNTANIETSTNNIDLLLDSVDGADGVIGTGRGLRLLGRDIDASEDKLLSTNTSGELNINVVTQSLPAGAATEATQLLVEANTASVVTALVSVKTTAGGTIPAGSKAASIFIDGIGATINLVERPDGWSQSFEFNNNTLPDITYNGNNTATVYVDILT
jgi:hypothetical protein